VLVIEIVPKNGYGIVLTGLVAYANGQSRHE
jgi:hypothetical protein